jgi:hypothetical protein
MNAQNQQQTVSRAVSPPARIRFSDADGKVLTWMRPSESVQAGSRLLREFRPAHRTVAAAILAALRALTHGGFNTPEMSRGKKST